LIIAIVHAVAWAVTVARWPGSVGLLTVFGWFLGLGLMASLLNL
jgi:hypothetical protein